MVDTERESDGGRQKAIVNPIRNAGTPLLGPVAVLAATEPDMRGLAGQFGYPESDGRRLFISRLYNDPERPETAALAGPMIGAPYAVMILETLIAWGARRFVFMGWCGALSPDLRFGDLMVPTSALIDEGTSAHYLGDAARSAPGSRMAAAIGEALQAGKSNHRAHTGAVWTTDAVFRETRERLATFQERGALAVDMETSALFTVAAFRQVEIGALLVVSDSLAGADWQPGFRDPRFKASRQAAHRVLSDLCRKWCLLK